MPVRPDGFSPAPKKMAWRARLGCSFFGLLRQAQAALAHTRGVDFFRRQDDALRKVWHITPLVVLSGKERLVQQRLGQRFLRAGDPPA